MLLKWELSTESRLIKYLVTFLCQLLLSVKEWQNKGENRTNIQSNKHKQKNVLPLPFLLITIPQPWRKGEGSGFIVCWAFVGFVFFFLIITQIIDYWMNSYFKRNKWALSLPELSEPEDNLYINTGLTFLPRSLSDSGKKNKRVKDKHQVHLYFW